MLYIFMKRKLEESYATLSKDIQKQVFPGGREEYIFIGTALNTLFKKQDIFKLIQCYASVYTFYKLELGNCAKTFVYAKKKTEGILSDYDCKTLIGLIMLTVTSGTTTISDLVAKVNEYRKNVFSYLNTVEGIQKNRWRFTTDSIEAGTVNSPLLVDGIRGVHQYIESLIVPEVENISFERTSVLYLTDNICNVSYAIDEYTLTNADNGTKIASLWFNIYGTENTEVQPVCFSDKKPFAASEVVPELFEQGVSQLQSIKEICINAQVTYDHKKLVISTLAYFYVIFIFSFKGLRSGQEMDLKDMYVERFGQYNKEIFKGLPDKQLLDIEQTFKDMLKSVDARVRVSYQENNYTLLDDGLSDEYISEFVLNVESVSEIRNLISDKMMSDWPCVGKKADETYLT